ncbi:MAG TPA: hypothetical protein VEH51_04760 [Burkholderiales bacterium]|nr:hypothetical protein [Burkholderiales bacterium]
MIVRGAWLRLLLAASALALAACAPMAVQRQAEHLERTEGKEPTVVVMPLDVELAELTAGGIPEPQADWTRVAVRNMRAALEDEARHYKVRLIYYDGERGTAEDRTTSLQLVKLHGLVGRAVLRHQYNETGRLPSKGGKFDWSLGREAAAVARSQGADYALFLYVRDSYASGGRVAVMVVAALMMGYAPGGAQVGFASLVDLKSGDIVWFNRLARASGDLRTPAAASETVKVLVSDSLK